MMELFYRIKRDGKGLFIKMYSDCEFPWYAASYPINHRNEAPEIFASFVADIKKDIIK